MKCIVCDKNSGIHKYCGCSCVNKKTVYVVQEKSGHTWIDLSPFYIELTDAISHRNESRKMFERQLFRVIERIDIPISIK